VILAIANCNGTGRYGTATVAGRFDSGSDDELVASTPFCSFPDDPEAGAIFNAERVFEDDQLRLNQFDYPPAGDSDDDHFGAALAGGDFNGDGFTDLAASAADKDHGTGNPSDSGRVYVVYGRIGDLNPSLGGSDIIGEDEWAGDTPGEGEHFGSALAAGDVDGDGFEDLLAGAPGEGTFDVGRIYLKRGSASGITITNNALFTQTFLGGSNGDDDHLGNVIALGDVDGDGVLEIALGVPDKDVGAASDAGMVYVTRAFGPRLFSDGFESGNKAAWSTSTP
jgi:FG-GAP repeat